MLLKNTDSTPHDKTDKKDFATRYTVEKVLAIRYWTSGLMSFTTSRSSDFRFKPGHYARLGLNCMDGSAVWRPFSVVSSLYDSYLEFFAMLVTGGEFSELLSRISVGDSINMDKSSYGFMTIDSFAPGKDLWLLASGTGLGPYLSILRDPTTWESYDNLILVHSVRFKSDLAYRDEIAAIPAKMAESPTRLRYIPVVTRESLPGALTARIPQLIKDCRLEKAAGVKLSLNNSRIMVCGNPEMIKELRVDLTAKGFQTNRRAAPGQLAFENYWQSKA